MELVGVYIFLEYLFLTVSVFAVLYAYLIKNDNIESQGRISTRSVSLCRIVGFISVLGVVALILAMLILFAPPTDLFDSVLIYAPGI